ncbi:ABC transporter ATP-binding protein, partial [Bacteroidota bacterium]
MLTVKNLTISLREGSFERQLIENISFTLKSGESLGIVGESGSGKTITALSILKLLPPGMRISGGDILLEQTQPPATAPEISVETPPMLNLATLSEKQIIAFRGRVISMIFQEPMTSLNPSMRCGDQIGEAVGLHTDLSGLNVKDKVKSLLAEVHLPGSAEFYRKYPHQLSGGQRQRVMIAMALAGNPEILIADEPTTALDVTVQKKILELLEEIRKNRQMSMLFISHDLGVIRTICENALVMYDGKIVEAGKVSQLFDNAGNPYTKGLIACRPGKSETGSNKPQRLPTLSDFMDQSSVSISQPEAGNPKPGRDKKPLRPIDQITTTPEESPLLEVSNLRVEY